MFLRNTCTQHLDVKVAVRDKDKRTKTFTFMNIAKNDTMTPYACNGTGKYMFWARKAGDVANAFPTEDEINAMPVK